VGSKISAQGQQKLDLLQTARRKTERLHSLVEQYAATAGPVCCQIARTAIELGRALMGRLRADGGL
jgi:hypothetical protein